MHVRTLTVLFVILKIKNIFYNYYYFRKFLYPPPYGWSPPAKNQNYPCFGSSFPKACFFKKIDLLRKFISETIISEVHFRNTAISADLSKHSPPPIIYPKSKQKVAEAKICANRIPKLHQGSNHTAKQHSKALNPNTL